MRSAQSDKDLAEYWSQLDVLKHQVLRALAVGLGLDKMYFSRRHMSGNDSLRLLHYPSVQAAEGEEPKLRCKEHSDYGSITLLLRDDCPGLQVFRDGGEGWCDVPYIPGTLVLNAGSLLKDWTGGAVKATVHRVVAPPEVLALLHPSPTELASAIQ